MQLSKAALRHIEKRPGLEISEEKLFDLPEKVLQFGTGVLLRGLPDYFIDKANKKGIFNGRIVVVKSTESDSSAFDRQDGLYTLCVRGIENADLVDEQSIISAISRVLSAKTDWKAILECADNPELSIIISNTTEVGIQLEKEDRIQLDPPVSFPGKLLAVLYRRFKTFKGSPQSGLVIVPTELITDNGHKLKAIVQQLAALNGLEAEFTQWLDQHNSFCNSLVDRIVPGKPNAVGIKKVEAHVGYHDELLIMSEVFRLWAIEGGPAVKEVLSFAKADSGMVVTPDITLFKELKLRLLNGTHSFNCGLAFLAGFGLTREAQKDQVFSKFARHLMLREIANAIPYPIEEKVRTDFARSVLERFENPYIDHQWISISVQYSLKMKSRTLPLLLQHYERYKQAPVFMATSFAGYILFTRPTTKTGQQYFGSSMGAAYEIKDDAAAYFFEAWKNPDADRVVEIILQEKALWDTDLTLLPGWLPLVQQQLQLLMTIGVMKTLSMINENNA